MSEREEKLRELIAKWRKLAAPTAAGPLNGVQQLTLLGCADGVEALLAEPQPRQEDYSKNRLLNEQPAPPSLSAEQVRDVLLRTEIEFGDKQLENCTRRLNALWGAVKPADNYAEIDRLALVITKAVAEERDRVLDQLARALDRVLPCVLRDTGKHDWACVNCDKRREIMAALKSQVSVTGASHDK